MILRGHTAYKALMIGGFELNAAHYDLRTELGVTEADISRVSRVAMPRDGIVTARQGHSDPNVQDDVYSELALDEVPEVAFHACRHKRSSQNVDRIQKTPLSGKLNEA